MSYKPVKYVLFDMDGLLLDTERIYKKVFQELCSEYGKNYTDEIRVKVLGTVPRMSHEIIINELDLPITEPQFHDIIQPKLEAEMENVDYMPGAERLVDHLVAHNIPIAIASSSQRKLFEIKMKKRPQFLSKFHHYVLGSDDPEVKNGKPAPDVYLVCASRFPGKADPADCLVFEDAPNGIKAGISAGMQAVLVPESIIPEEERKLATTVIPSLLDFDPEEFSLPKFKNE